LRFTRDKRGYETTSLVHAGRHQGRSRQRILYWFRTPPGVKVGRPALDEDAIRWIEEHNPDIKFDWPKILQAQPPAAPPPEDPRTRRGRRDRADAGGARVKPDSTRRRPAPPQPPPAVEVQEPADVSADTASVETVGEVEVVEEGEVVEEVEVVEEALEQLTHPDAEEDVEPSAMPVEHSLNHEQLVRLRARYAELQARITERGGDAERVEALRLQAESLSPDTWVTEDEVRRGIEEFEPKMRELRATLGLHRRRRSRRGGRRRKQAPPESGSAPDQTGEG
jgi:hypothetical protein